ncbi:MAG: hypothetical protein F4089_10410 [Gammaproteobacteria bacterium]|nr:hypothetical protein [Gammaproteobacteria bacterium]MYJ75470.1 hypothetical protein [Gammaproteobacteria bacterium]
MPRRPLVIFNPDRWRGDALGHLGHPAVKTPTSTGWWLARRFSFRHAFVQATADRATRTRSSNARSAC